MHQIPSIWCISMTTDWLSKLICKRTKSGTLLPFVEPEPDEGNWLSQIYSPFDDFKPGYSGVENPSFKSAKLFLEEWAKGLGLDKA